jgi:hypothetical protein
MQQPPRTDEYAATFLESWPTSAAEAAPASIPRFIGVREGEESWSGLVMPREDFHLRIASIRQREEVLRADHVFEDAADASWDSTWLWRVLKYPETRI